MYKINFLLSNLPSTGQDGEEASSEVRGAGERKKEKGQCRREKKTQRVTG